MVLQIARRERWQRCQKCFTMVELNHGCFHITCKCGAQFCYLCGAKWKTCQCDHWEEHRLYERAEQIYNRDHNAVEDDPVEDVPVEGIPVEGVQDEDPDNDMLRYFVINPREYNPARALPSEHRPPEAPLSEYNPPEDSLDGDNLSEDHLGEGILGSGVMNPQPLSPQADRELHIERIMEHLRQNHECDHEHWANRRGPEKSRKSSEFINNHGLGPQVNIRSYVAVSVADI
ncbi:hypothetical protein O1611_g7905 [Lasiodiplodia mahajangana]|uniref:Uncharacterized protein n=1 Tax=Lasiodiplodia mahajangana TaxID=1108764 RepID=A0ACC2JE34_9PEZI|nr:hypothetical protein O1611_g7905 [Lasiodiplodia mahajangana]